MYRPIAAKRNGSPVDIGCIDAPLETVLHGDAEKARDGVAGGGRTKTTSAHGLAERMRAVRAQWSCSRSVGLFTLSGAVRAQWGCSRSVALFALCPHSA